MSHRPSLIRHLGAWMAALVVAVALGAIGPSAARADEQPEPTSLEAITTGEDFRQPHAEILRLYFAVFDRAPDVGGAVFWIDRYNGGDSIERIADIMFHSPEFIARYGDTSNAAFVEALYGNVLDREPDPSGFAFWADGLDARVFARLWVLRHFADSTEFVEDHRFPGEADAPAGPPMTRPVGIAGPITTFSVEIEASLGWNEVEAQQQIVAILGDARSWVGAETVRFQLVDRDADVRIRIATPATVDARCRPLRTGGRLSCRNGRFLNINSDRWAGATSFWPASLADYRSYLINHEMGHYLGHGHRNCPGRGTLAPVMQQQTKSLQGCVANGWPYP